MSEEKAAAVLAGVASVRGWQEELYRDLQAHPELSTGSTGPQPWWLLG